MARSLPLEPFHAPTRAWFEEKLGAPTRAQSMAFGPLASGKSALILAPTGSGKTLAAFLTAIDRLMHSPEPEGPQGKAQRCRVLYVSPLKALAVDIERNLQAPLSGIAEVAARTGARVRVPTVLVRTGDTPQKDRAKMRRAPPDILITTPESLFLILTSEAAKTLAYVETVIVDEIHALVPSKRGAHLMLSLERLDALRERTSPGGPALQRVGLSATQRPLEVVARLLGGFEAGRERPVHVVDAGIVRAIEVTVEMPDDEPATPPAKASQRSIWPHVHQRLVALIREHTSTLVFVNSRRLAERLASALNEVAGEEIALAHHGSVAHDKRRVIEERLKKGELPAVVATSSLELGIDMGAIDLVVQVEAPPSVAAGLQRIGRAGHGVGQVSRGVVFPKHKGDLLPCAATIAAMRAGRVESTAYPKNPLDVLAQQLVAIASDAPIATADLYALVRGAAPFADLPRGAFEGVLDMLSGRYPSDDFAGLRARLVWDRTANVVRAREGARRLVVANAGTIPDRGLYGVFLATQADDKRARRVGELDEEMVFELREGEVFLLGASSWRAEQITHDRVLVTPAAGEPGKMPFWHGDRPGRPLELGIAIGALAREIAASPTDEAARMLAAGHGLNPKAAEALTTYVADQARATGELPTDRSIVVERFVDELGDFRVCVLSPFGARVHAPWATAIVDRLRDVAGPEIEVEPVWSDDGMAFRFPALAEPPPEAWFFPPPDEIEAIVTKALGGTSLFASHFRECAARALLLPRRRPGQRTALWAQRKRAHDLLAIASAHPEFPIVLETLRECLRDVFDMPGLVDLLRKVETREIRVTTVDTRAPSAFASSLLFSFVASFIYDGDAPLAERRAQALSIDQAQLAALLGEAELRSLLDPAATQELARILTHLAYPARHADAVHDLLLAVGDLSQAEVRARCAPASQADAWLEQLGAAGRIARVQIAGEPRWAAMEDMGKLQGALGVTPPAGTPAVFLEPSRDAIGDLVARYARTHTPFVAADVVRRLGVAPAVVEAALGRLVARGKLTSGAYLPDGREGTTEYCDVEVLRSLRGKSLARLRRAVEPVDDAAYGRLQLEWQLPVRRGPDALRDAIRQLEGAALPASDLESAILPARAPGYRAGDLDALCASGDVVWAGVEPLGARDGRVMLFSADHEALLTPAPRVAEGPMAARIRELLGRRGAVFFGEIERALGGYPAEIVTGLWAMVWAGEVTNDTLEPLRTLARAQPARDARARARHLAHVRPFGRDPIPRMGVRAEGRWSLRASRWGRLPSETERRAAQARVLLERYGVVTREAVLAEAMCEGFSATYAVLKAMEESGRVRRGYFVAGRGATQFALPGADDRLRAVREPGLAMTTRVLAATDPANPYGAALPWPAAGEPGVEPRDSKLARPQRAAGALVLLCDGALAAWLGKNRQSLLTFLPAEEPLRGRVATALAEALATLVDEGTRRVLLLASIDGTDGASAALAAALTRAGFTPGDKGWMRKPSTPTSAPPVAGRPRTEAAPRLRDRLGRVRAGRG